MVRGDAAARPSDVPQKEGKRIAHEVKLLAKARSLRPPAQTKHSLFAGELKRKADEMLARLGFASERGSYVRSLPL